MNTGRIITTALAASILAIPAMAADAPGYFKVPGTETSLQVYGYAGLDATYDLNGNGGVKGADYKKYNPTNQWNMVARGRLGVTTTTPSALGDVVTKIEWNGADMGIRHCYMTVAGLKVGQGETLWDAVESNSLGSMPAVDIDTERVAQISYTFNPTKQITAGLSFEQPNAATDVNSPAGVNHKVPGAIVGLFDFSDSWGSVGGRILNQKYEYWAAGNPATSYSKNGTSFKVYGSINIAKDSLQVSVISGKGLGTYGTFAAEDNGGMFSNTVATKKIELYKTLGIFAQYNHVWTPTVSSSVGVSQVKYSKLTVNGTEVFGGDSAANAADIKSMTSFYVQTGVALTKTVNFTAAYEFGDKKTWGTVTPSYGDAATKSRKESEILLRLDATLW